MYLDCHSHRNPVSISRETRNTHCATHNTLDFYTVWISIRIKHRNSIVASTHWTSMLCGYPFAQNIGIARAYTYVHQHNSESGQVNVADDTSSLLYILHPHSRTKNRVGDAPFFPPKPSRNRSSTVYRNSMGIEKMGHLWSCLLSHVCWPLTIDRTHPRSMVQPVRSSPTVSFFTDIALYAVSHTSRFIYRSWRKLDFVVAVYRYNLHQNPHLDEKPPDWKTSPPPSEARLLRSVSAPGN